MGLSAIICKNISKCCTAQKSTQINHRNIYISYSTFSACAVCQLITYTPAQGSARKQYIQHDLLAMVSQNWIFMYHLNTLLCMTVLSVTVIWPV